MLQLLNHASALLILAKYFDNGDAEPLHFRGYGDSTYLTSFPTEQPMSDEDNSKMLSLGWKQAKFDPFGNIEWVEKYDPEACWVLYI